MFANNIKCDEIIDSSPNYNHESTSQNLQNIIYINFRLYLIMPGLNLQNLEIEYRI